ncbi:hypothetical protein M0R45_035706 [Rubus argutus]|uniref:Uncharacterized protein n=1 Tax=Rubus argutus TaxID=59490 RepID=A0AAW1VTX9_RUBAR
MKDGSQLRMMPMQLKWSYSRNNTSSLAEDVDTDGFDANEGVGTEFGNDIEFVNEDGKGSSAINGANQQSQSTFAGLSDVKGKKNKKQVRQSTVPKKNRKKPKATRYNTRKKGNKKYKAVENSDDSDEGSDFYVDSDYDLQQDDDDYSQFEENVANPRVVEEFNDMGFRGKCSDDGGDL